MSDRNNGTGLDGAGLGSAVPRLPELDPPFDIIEPEVEACPVVFSSPHSGSIYPAAFLKAARLDPLTLRRSEDAFVDELFIPALSIGAPMLRARFPRAYLDVNREPFELDPRMFDGRLPSHANTRSIRVAGGLGTIARIVGEAQEIYWGRLPVAEAMLRIEALHRPYHAALKALVERTRKRFGMAVLVDCHSMPSSNLPTENGGKADVVLGDRYGTACAGVLPTRVERALEARGYRVARNAPYAGGYTTEFYGQPRRRTHALQIEINRALYLDEATLSPTSGFETLKADVEILTRALAEADWSALNAA